MFSSIGSRGLHLNLREGIIVETVKENLKAKDPTQRGTKSQESIIYDNCRWKAFDNLKIFVSDKRRSLCDSTRCH